MKDFKIAQIRRRVRALVKRAADEGSGVRPDYMYGPYQRTVDNLVDWGKGIGLGSLAGYLGNELIHMPKPNPAYGLGGNATGNELLQQMQGVLTDPNATRLQKDYARSMIAAAQLRAQEQARRNASGAPGSVLDGLTPQARRTMDTLLNVRPDGSLEPTFARETAAALGNADINGASLRPELRALMDDPVFALRNRPWYDRILRPARSAASRDRAGYPITTREAGDILQDVAERQTKRITGNPRITADMVQGLVDAPQRASWLRRWAREAFSPHASHIDESGQQVPGLRGKLRKATLWGTGIGGSLYLGGKLFGGGDRPVVTDEQLHTDKLNAAIARRKAWEEQQKALAATNTPPAAASAPVTNTPPVAAGAPIPPPPPTAPQKSPISGGHGR